MNSIPVIVSIVALLISFASAWFSYKQWKTSTQKDRAWVIPAGAYSHVSPDHYWLMTPKVTLKNGGTTPAQKFETRYHWKIYDSSEFPPTPDYAGCKITHPGAIGAGESAHRIYDIPLTMELHEQFTKHQKFLFIYGGATYEDIFEIKHYTEWCYIFVPEHQHFERHAVFNRTT